MNILVSKDGGVEGLSSLPATSTLSIQPDTNKPQQNCLANLIKLGLMGASLLILPLPGNAAISATTSKTIQGTEPYFTWNGTPITNFNNLLTARIRYVDTGTGTTVNAVPTGTTITTNAMMKESDIQTLISGGWSSLLSATSTTLALSSSIGTAGGSFGVGDDDDDAATGAGASGIITATLLKDGQGIAPTGNPFSVCSTYQLKLAVVPPTGGTINATTAFGDPKVSSSYPAQTVTYTLQPGVTSTTTVQFAKPNLTNGTGVYAGNPAWNTTNGFILQNLATPSSNFPTMGFNGAFFDVKLNANDANKVIGCKDAGGNGEVSITVAPKPGSTDEVRVTLNGPTDGNRPSGTHSATTFRLKLGGRDIYTFEIGKWFIAKPSIGGVGHPWDSSNLVGFPPQGSTGGYETPRYCAGLGTAGDYRVPSVLGDYTNATVSVGFGGWGGNYTRTIGGGLFAEWGYTHNGYYTTSDFESNFYWAREVATAFNQYIVGSNNGDVNYNYDPNFLLSTACVSP